MYTLDKCKIIFNYSCGRAFTCLKKKNKDFQTCVILWFLVKICGGKGETMTSTPSFAYIHFECSRNVSWNTVTILQFHIFFSFNLIFINFHCSVWFFCFYWTCWSSLNLDSIDLLSCNFCAVQGQCRCQSQRKWVVVKPFLECTMKTWINYHAFIYIDQWWSDHVIRCRPILTFLERSADAIRRYKYAEVGGRGIIWTRSCRSSGLQMLSISVVAEDTLNHDEQEEVTSSFSVSNCDCCQSPLSFSATSRWVFRLAMMECHGWW